MAYRSRYDAPTIYLLPSEEGATKTRLRNLPETQGQSEYGTYKAVEARFWPHKAVGARFWLFE